jgi:flagellum-specific peptidoglycan hydrolase FlgJ
VKPADFIALLAPGARSSQRACGVFASITVAQAALESAWGESGLAKSAKNLFGIKADSLWRGDTVTLNTKEFIKGHWVEVPAQWRKYPSWQVSIQDHAAFLKRNPRYRGCFACSTAQAFVLALAAAGYATDPAYADKLISLIDKYQLHLLDGDQP